ncbi:MAG: hypothetical protein KJ880_01510 [Candidatus Omnitrophica bacterium]|nr:hypothetical protein [Candidatus Omnitrophota bacterium]
MKTYASIVLIIATTSFILAIISRIMMVPLPIVPGGLEAQALLAFTNTCLLLAAVMILLQILKSK